MMPTKFILSFLFFLLFVQLGSAQQVSYALSQMLSIENSKDNPPKSIYIKLNTPDIKVEYMRGTRVMVTGTVKLGIPNLFFLEVLIKKGRYDLFLSADGGTGLRLEDKERQPMVLQGNNCDEYVSYTIYIPETIKTVVFENASTGDSNIIAMKERKRQNTSSVTASSTNDPQVLIKDK